MACDYRMPYRIKTCNKKYESYLKLQKKLMTCVPENSRSKNFANN